jgi:hypothetical protein
MNAFLAFNPDDSFREKGRSYTMWFIALVLSIISAALFHKAFQYSVGTNMFFGIGAIAVFFALFAINCWMKNSRDRTSDDPLWWWLEIWRWWR